MTFEFHWNNKEANFGLPMKREVDGGTHFSIEIIPKHKEKYVAVRRPQGYPGHQLPPKAQHYPKGCLYFCHGLPEWGETTEGAITRIVKSLLNVDVESFKILDLDMATYPDNDHEGNNQWAITVYVEAELTSLPKTTEEVTELAQFTKDNIPEDMGWWSKEKLQEVLH